MLNTDVKVNGKNVGHVYEVETTAKYNYTPIETSIKLKLFNIAFGDIVSIDVTTGKNLVSFKKEKDRFFIEGKHEINKQEAVYIDQEKFICESSSYNSLLDFTIVNVAK